MTDTIGSDTPKISDTTVSVSRVVSATVKSVWKALMTKEGAEALLGEGAEIGDKGHTWSSVNGKSGVIRSLHPLEQIRFSIRREDGKFGPSMVEVDLTAIAEQTQVTITHSSLTEDVDKAWLVSRWEAALDRIEVHVAED
ncbi:MAG: SRPBCC domain-containing protein [Propionibacteriaceae bacterium]|jgi:uncharacterized protein YndB with AHSA1/START domain|nr:SRPBCC domain-containing protein [Propionibacteriaceae bacterium]